MRGVWRSCLAQLGLWAAMATIFYLAARSAGLAGAEATGVSIVSGLLLSMALLVAASAVRAAAERRMLSRTAGGAAPRDGAWTAVGGQIRCRSPLRAPISGELVAAYEYSIGRDERIGRTASLVTYFDGKALAPSSVVTAHGEVRLLTVPALEVEPAGVAEERALANARSHVRGAVFEKRDTARERTSALEREWADDDGSFRIDKRHFTADVDLADRFRFEERHIRPGDTVCVFGVYSTERAGVVPDVRWGRASRMVRGTPTQLAGSLRGRVIRYAIGSLILASLAVGGALVYLRTAA